MMFVQAEVTLAWTFSPEGAVILGEEGPVTHLGCEGDAVYDWSMGLIFKRGRYFDPNTGIWLSMAPALVWQRSQRLNRRQRQQYDKQRRIYILFLLLFVMLLLAGCKPEPDPTPPGPTPTTTPCPTPTTAPTPLPTIPAPSSPTPIPTSTPHPPTPTPLPTPTPTNIPLPETVDGLKFENPFGHGTPYFINAYYGYHLNKDNEPIGYQTDLGNGQGQGHPGIDLIPQRYATESKDNNYVASENHRELYAPVTGYIKRGGSYSILIENVTTTRDVVVELVHVDPNEAPADGTLVFAGQPLNSMTFKGRGYGEGSEYPHLHIGIYHVVGNYYVNPKDKLPEGNLGSYWSYKNSDESYFTQLPYDG